MPVVPGLEDGDSKPKVVYVTQWFAPEPDGPAGWIPQTIRSLGFDVSVLTAIPNYPLGKTYSGYSSWRIRRETRNEFEVFRVPVYPSHDHSSLRRMLNYLSFAANSSIFGLRACSKADLVLVYCSPETAAWSARISRFFRRTPYVLYVQDLWPESALGSGMLGNGLVARFARGVLTRMDRILTKSAFHIITISDGMRLAYLDRGFSPEQVTTIYNWAPTTANKMGSYPADLRAHLGLSAGCLLFMYAGNHGIAQGLDAWLDAAESCSDLEEVAFVFIGEGTEKESLSQRMLGSRTKNCHFLDGLSAEEFDEIAPQADAQIVSLRDDPLFAITIPSKIQAAMARGQAILGSLSGEAATIIEKSGGGFVSHPSDVRSIELMIREAAALGRDGLHQRGAAAREYYETHMSEAVAANLLRRILLSAASLE